MKALVKTSYVSCHPGHNSAKTIEELNLSKIPLQELEDLLTTVINKPQPDQKYIIQVMQAVYQDHNSYNHTQIDMIIARARQITNPSPDLTEHLTQLYKLKDQLIYKYFINFAQHLKSKPYYKSFEYISSHYPLSNEVMNQQIDNLKVALDSRGFATIRFNLIHMALVQVLIFTWLEKKNILN